MIPNRNPWNAPTENMDEFLKYHGGPGHGEVYDASNIHLAPPEVQYEWRQSKRGEGISTGGSITNYGAFGNVQYDPNMLLKNKETALRLSHANALIEASHGDALIASARDLRLSQKPTVADNTGIATSARRMSKEVTHGVPNEQIATRDQNQWQVDQYRNYIAKEGVDAFMANIAKRNGTFNTAELASINQVLPKGTKFGPGLITTGARPQFVEPNPIHRITADEWKDKGHDDLLIHQMIIDRSTKEELDGMNFPTSVFSKEEASKAISGLRSVQTQNTKESVRKSEETVLAMAEAARKKKEVDSIIMHQVLEGKTDFIPGVGPRVMGKDAAGQDISLDPSHAAAPFYNRFFEKDGGAQPLSTGAVNPASPEAPQIAKSQIPPALPPPAVNSMLADEIRNMQHFNPVALANDMEQSFYGGLQDVQDMEHKAVAAARGLWNAPWAAAQGIREWASPIREALYGEDDPYLTTQRRR